MILRSQLQHNLVRWLSHSSAAGRQPVSTGRQPFALTEFTGGGLAGIRHFPSHLQSLWVGLPHSWLGHDILCWQLRVASHFFQYHRGWGKGLTNSLQLWWGREMVNICPLLPRNPAWLCSLRIPTCPYSRVNRWRGSHSELNPSNPGHRAEHPLYLRPSHPRLYRTSLEGPQRQESLSWVEHGLFDREYGGDI